MWNFKGTLWNSTQNILPIHWKMWLLYNIDILRALRVKSSYAFLKRPPGQWWRSLTIYRGKRSTSQIMMTSSNGSIFRVTGPLCGEFTGPGEFPTQRPVTRSFDVFFDLRLNKRLSKQPWGWWSETPSSSLWRHRNDVHGFVWLCFVVHHRPS